MKIAIAADHAGFGLKATLKTHLEGLGHTVEDLGAHELHPDDDYTDVVEHAARMVANGGADRGIVIGGSGQGEAMAANRVRGVRAAVYYGGSDDVLRLSREHNDANVLSLAARFLSVDEATYAAERWLDTPFSGEERHLRRIKKLDD